MDNNIYGRCTCGERSPQQCIQDCVKRPRKDTFEISGDLDFIDPSMVRINSVGGVPDGSFTIDYLQQRLLEAKDRFLKRVNEMINPENDKVVNIRSYQGEGYLDLFIEDVLVGRISSRAEGNEVIFKFNPANADGQIMEDKS